MSSQSENIETLLIWRHRIEQACAQFNHAPPWLPTLLLLMWTGDIDAARDLWTQSSLWVHKLPLMIQELDRFCTRSNGCTAEQCIALYAIIVATMMRQRRPDKKIAVVVRPVSYARSLPVLGRGSHASVYLLPKERSHLKRDYAIKSVRLFRSRGLDESSIVELMTLCALDLEDELPVVPRVKNVYVDFENNSMLMIMQKFKCSLYDYFSRVPSSPLDVISIMQTVTYVISVAHSQGIVHLDLKPSNVLVSDDDVIVVADWGLARLVGERGDQSTFGHTFVTVTHRPPELLLGYQRLGTFTDVWSAGCILFETLANGAIHSDMTEYQALVRIAKWIGAPTEAFQESNKDQLAHLASFPDGSLALPNFPRRPMSRAAHALIKHYASKMGESEMQSRAVDVLSRALDASIQWDWRARCSVFALNKILFQVDPS